LLVAVGGSNDQSYPNVSALLSTYPNKPIAVINLDSHFDVRPLKEGKAHSGSPFRLMLEDPRFA
jgi:formiminoglutamase